MTSATRVNASVRRPSIGRRCSGSRPSRIDSPSRRSLTRPTSVSAERPVEVGRVAARDDVEGDPERRLERRRPEPDSSAMLRGVGGDAALAGEVGADAPQVEVREAQRLTGDAFEVAGQDALAEVAELDHEHDPVSPALDLGGGRQAIEDVELGVEAHVGVCSTTRSTWLSIGDRISVIGAADARPDAVASTFSIRDSPIDGDPGLQQLAGDLGRAERRLGDAGDRRCPRSAEAIDEDAGVVVDPVEADLEPRGGHVAALASLGCELGKGPEDHVDQAVRGAGERVGGRDAELELVERDGGGDLGVGHVLVVDREADDLGVGERLDQVDLAGRRGHRRRRGSRRAACGPARAAGRRAWGWLPRRMKVDVR